MMVFDCVRNSHTVFTIYIVLLGKMVCSLQDTDKNFRVGTLALILIVSSMQKYCILMLTSEHGEMLALTIV
jgi:hypothetical protein